MLKSEALDVVAIATPNDLHKPLTIAALEAGCHVLCEKPMATNAREAQAMLDASERMGKRLMINFSYRFSKTAMALHDEVHTGILDDVYFARTVWLRRRGLPGFGGWFGTKKRSGGGPLIDLGVHRLDLALWLMDYPKPVWVMASTYNHLASAIARAEGKTFDVEDTAISLVKFENAATLEIEASWASHIRDREHMETRLLGTNGGLVQYNTDGGYTFDADIFSVRNGKEINTKPRLRGKHPESSIEHFVDCILSNKPHTCTAREGLTVMKLLDAIYKSAQKGAPVKIRD